MTKEQIKTLRQSLNLSPTDFSNKIGYSYMHINQVELGKLKIGPKLIIAINRLIEKGVDHENRI